MSEPQPTPHHHGNEPQVHRITEARESHKVEQNSRVMKYTISMSVRLVCFLAAFVTHGWVQWVCFAGAIVLPYIAVVIANGGADLTKREPPAQYYKGDDPRLLTAAPNPTPDPSPEKDVPEPGFADNYGETTPDSYPRDVPETIDGTFVTEPTEPQAAGTDDSTPHPSTQSGKSAPRSASTPTPPTEDHS